MSAAARARAVALAMASLHCLAGGCGESGGEGDSGAPADGASPDASSPDSATPDAAVGDAGTPADAGDAAVADGSAPPDGSPPTPGSCESGSITYSVGGESFRTTLGESPRTQNLTEAFDGVASGSDSWVTTSPDGEWYLVSTERVACEGWACLAVASADLSAFEIVRIEGEVVHAARFSAIASGGRRIVYVHDVGEGLGLYVSDREGDGWSTPRLLTGDSPFTFNVSPTFSDDGAKVAFDCTEEVYSQPPTSICEVNLDGTGFRALWTPVQGGEGAPGRAEAALHSPAYLPDGSVVFEADWTGEQLWHLVGDGPPVRIAREYSNDNSPCTLPSGCIASLWLGRPDGAGEHELKVMDVAGGGFRMIRTGVDVSDTGLSCSL